MVSENSAVRGCADGTSTKSLEKRPATLNLLKEDQMMPLCTLLIDRVTQHDVSYAIVRGVKTDWPTLDYVFDRLFQ